MTKHEVATTVTITFGGPLTAREQAFLSQNPVPYSASRSILGGDEITTLILALTPLSGIVIKGLTSIIVARLESRRHVAVAVDGVEVRGLSEQTVERLLIQQMQSRAAKEVDNDEH